jgi:hypothetical protein
MCSCLAFSEIKFIVRTKLVFGFCPRYSPESKVTPFKVPSGKSRFHERKYLFDFIITVTYSYLSLSVHSLLHSIYFKYSNNSRYISNIKILLVIRKSPYPELIYKKSFIYHWVVSFISDSCNPSCLYVITSKIIFPCAYQVWRHATVCAVWKRISIHCWNNSGSKWQFSLKHAPLVRKEKEPHYISNGRLGGAQNS